MHANFENSKVALVYGQMNEPPGARMRVALTALTMAEYFRDTNKQDVLLFVDNIFRFVQAGSEVSTLLGRMPSAVGYQPTLSTEVGELQERITSTKEGSITSIQAVYVPADDLTDPAPSNVFRHLRCNNCIIPSISCKRNLPCSRSFRFNINNVTTKYCFKSPFYCSTTSKTNFTKIQRITRNYCNFRY